MADAPIFTGLPVSAPVVNEKGFVTDPWYAYLLKLSKATLVLPATSGYAALSGGIFSTRTFQAASNKISITFPSGNGNSAFDVVPGNIDISTLTGTLNTSQLPNVNISPGTYGSVTNSAIITVTSKGLAPTVTDTPIQIAESQVTNLVTDLSNKLTNSNNLSDVSSVATSNNNLVATTSVSGVTTLSSSAYGTHVICTGSSAYTVTLPAATANQWIRFNINTTSNALITIAPASGTINGQSNIVLGTYEGCEVYSDGTNWITRTLSLQPVSCRVFLNNNLTLSTATITTVPFDAATFDVWGFCDLVTNKGRFTPKYPGKYRCTVNCINSASTSASYMISYIYKNGSLYSENAFISSSTQAQTFPPINDLISLNGSTDFIDGRLQQTSGVNQTISAGTTTTFMSIERVALY